MGLAAAPPAARLVGPATVGPARQLVAVGARQRLSLVAGVHIGGDVLRAVLVGVVRVVVVALSVVGLHAEAILPREQPRQLLPDMVRALPELHALHADVARGVGLPLPAVGRVAVEGGTLDDEVGQVGPPVVDDGVRVAVVLQPEVVDDAVVGILVDVALDADGHAARRLEVELQRVPVVSCLDGKTGGVAAVGIPVHVVRRPTAPGGVVVERLREDAHQLPLVAAGIEVGV